MVLLFGFSRESRDAASAEERTLGSQREAWGGGLGLGSPCKSISAT